MYELIQRDAEKFLNTRTRFTGEVQHLDDGKKEFLVGFKWKELLKVMSQFFVAELAEIPRLTGKQL